MQQIANWLEKLGMSEYVQRFAENRIDLSGYGVEPVFRMLDGLAEQFSSARK